MVVYSRILYSHENKKEILHKLMWKAHHERVY